MPDIFEKINYPDLPDDLKMVADICGVDATRKLIKSLQGISIYFPKISKMENFINRYIKENKDKSLKLLARELTVSEQFIKKFI